MPFIEQRLLDCVAYGTSGGPTWTTRKVALRSGIVRRNPMRSRPVYRFSVIYRNLQGEDHAHVIAAFNACMGGVYPFRLKDWSDFEAVDEYVAIGTGSPQSVQLSKLYEFGTQIVARPIRKPIASTVELTENGSPLAATIDAVGVATFTATNGAIVRWSGEFDVPVMFSDDHLEFSGDDRNMHGLFLTSDVALEEDLSV